MATGFVPFGKGWDVAEIRQCQGVCKQPMRHRQVPIAEQPDTVRHLGDGLCDSCHQIMKPRKQRGYSAREEAVRLAEARKVQEKIRARRALLGITPDGRRLPRTVSTG